MQPRLSVAAFLIVSALSVGLWSAESRAEPKSAGAEPKKAAPAKPGDVDLDRSRVYVFVGRTGLGHEHGVEGKLKSGHLDWGAGAAAGELEFDMESFEADTEDARKCVGLEGEVKDSTRQQVTKTMRGTAVLNVEKFPTARFVVKTIAPLKKSRADASPEWQLDGDFTLHGETKPLRVVARAEEAEGMLHVRGRFAVLQTQYGIKPYSKGLGAVGVADELQIWGDLWIHRAK